MARTSKLPQRIEQAKRAQFDENGKPNVLNTLERKVFKGRKEIKDHTEFVRELKNYIKNQERKEALDFAETHGFVPEEGKNYSTAGKKEIINFFSNLVMQWLKTASKSEKSPQREVPVRDVEPKSKSKEVTREAKPENPQVSENDQLKEILRQLQNIQEEYANIKKLIEDIHEELNLSKIPEKSVEPKEIGLEKKYENKLKDFNPEYVEEIRGMLHDYLTEKHSLAVIASALSEVLDMKENEVQEDVESLQFEGLKKIFFHETTI